MTHILLVLEYFLYKKINIQAFLTSIFFRYKEFLIIKDKKKQTHQQLSMSIKDKKKKKLINKIKLNKLIKPNYQATQYLNCKNKTKTTKNIFGQTSELVKTMTMALD